jgi:hypothetical protein
MFKKSESLLTRVEQHLNEYVDAFDEVEFQKKKLAMSNKRKRDFILGCDDIF